MTGSRTACQSGPARGVEIRRRPPSTSSRRPAATSRRLGSPVLGSAPGKLDVRRAPALRHVTIPRQVQATPAISRARRRLARPDSSRPFGPPAGSRSGTWSRVSPGRNRLTFRIVVRTGNPSDGPGWHDFDVGHVGEELPCGEVIVLAPPARQVQHSNVRDRSEFRFVEQKRKRYVGVGELENGDRRTELDLEVADENERATHSVEAAIDTEVPRRGSTSRTPAPWSSREVSAHPRGSRRLAGWSPRLA